MATQSVQRMNLSPDEIASLPPQDQAVYTRNMSPAQQALVAQANQRRVDNANRGFLRNSNERMVYMPVTGGSGQTATYAQGQTLYFDFPSVPGYGTGLLIHYSLTYTLATGSSALYCLNAAAPWSIFSEVQVLYNGNQIRTHPYFLKVLDQSRGFLSGERNKVLAGINDSTIAANVVGSMTALASSGNTATGTMFLPLNALGKETVPGVLPVSGVGNHPQLKLTCTPTFLGLDPLLSPVGFPLSGGGTSHAASAVTGSINVDMVVQDGTNYNSPTPLTLAWQGQSTLQYFWDTALTPFNAGNIMRQTVSTKQKHYYVVSLIIDAASNQQFCQLGNISGFQSSPDQVGQQSFVNYGIANNVSIYDYYNFVRREFKQDFDNGVILWATAPTRGVTNSDNRNGMQAINMTDKGFPAWTHSYQMLSTNAAGGPNFASMSTTDGFAAPTPRVETFLISENPDGLRVAGTS